MTIGTLLKQVREGKEIPIEEASRDTKISLRYLMAIEDGRWRDLPGSTYTKGYLHIYADYLGLNAKEIIRQYEQEQGDIPYITPFIAKKSKKPKIYLVYIGIFVLLLACVLGFLYKRPFYKQEITPKKEKIPKEAMAKVSLREDPKLQSQPPRLNVTSIKTFREKMWVRRVSICKGIKNREPINPGTVFSIKDNLPIYCFTEICGAKGPQKIRHVWYYKDKKIMTTVLAVNGPRWRTWSKKTISRDLKGPWHIEILGPERELAHISFTVN